MGKIPPGLAAWQAAHRKGVARGNTSNADSQANSTQSVASRETTYPIPHQMVTAIKNSPKGKVPPGLTKYMKKGK